MDGVDDVDLVDGVLRGCDGLALPRVVNREQVGPRTVDRRPCLDGRGRFESFHYGGFGGAFRKALLWKEFWSSGQFGANLGQFGGQFGPIAASSGQPAAISVPIQCQFHCQFHYQFAANFEFRLFTLLSSPFAPGTAAP